MNRVDLSPVKKELWKLPTFILAKLYRWIKGVEEEGITEIRKIPGFHDEPLKGKRTGTRSVRLNKAYRLIYREIRDNEYVIIKVVEINKHEY